MTTARQCLQALGVMGLVLASPNYAQSEPYSDISGLGPGRYIWQPTAQENGPVVIYASLKHETVHVYRGGVEIGISKVRISRTGKSRAQPGVYLIDGPGQNAQSRSRRKTSMNWNGRAAYRETAANNAVLAGAVRLPNRFAELLSEVTHNGATLVIANERSRAKVLAINWPALATPKKVANNLADTKTASDADTVTDAALISTVSGVARNLYTDDAKAAVAETIKPIAVQGENAPVLVASLKASSAVMTLDGKEVWRGALDITEPGDVTGTQIYSRVPNTKRSQGGVRGQVADQPNWLTVAIGDTSAADHISNNRAAEMLVRIALAQPRQGAAISKALAKPGALIIVTDKDLPSTDTDTAKTALLTDNVPVARQRQKRQRVKRYAPRKQVKKPAPEVVRRKISPADILHSQD